MFTKESRILGVMSYIDEITLSLSLQSMLNQSRKVDEVLIVNKVYPMHKAFNLGLDHAYWNGFDYMFLLAADTILKPNALKVLQGEAVENVFIVSGISEDVIFGSQGAGGFLLYNMNMLGLTYRYREGPLEDWGFVQRILDRRKRDGWRRGKVKKQTLSIHHPVWTPRDIYMKMRFCLPKFKDNSKMLRKYRTFLDKGLKEHPNNMVFIVGDSIYKKLSYNLDNYVLQDKDSKALANEWEKYSKQFELIGDEFYAMPEFVEFAKEHIK